MRFKIVVAGVSTFAGATLLGVLAQNPASIQAQQPRKSESGSFDTSYPAAHRGSRAAFGDRAISPTEVYRERVVHAAVERLERSAMSNLVDAQATDTAAPLYRASEVERDEIRILREEKRALETQHIALVEQLRELRSALGEGKEAPASDALVAQLETERQIRQQVEFELAEAQKLIAEKQAEVEQARTALNEEAAKHSSCVATVQENEQILSRLPEIRDKFTALKELSDQKESALTECTTNLTSLKEVEATLPELKKEVEAKQNELLKCTSDLQSQAQIAGGIPMMKQQLIAAKNELLMKETELQVLRGAADAKTLAEIEKNKRPAPQKVAAAHIPPPPVQEVASDLLLVEVNKPKVSLRSGPGKEHSAVMDVQKGARLTVEAREGDWFRVFTPTGSRAYVSATVVRELTQRGAEKGSAAAQRAANKPAAATNTVPPQVQAVDRDNATTQAAAKDEGLVPWGVVNLSAGPNPEAEKRALNILKNGVGRPNAAPTPPSEAEEE